MPISYNQGLITLGKAMTSIRSFLKFAVVGLSGTLINVAVFNLLVLSPFLHHYYLIANTLSFLVAVTNNFYWNFKWTFQGKAKHKSTGRKYWQFVSVNTTTFFVNTLIILACVSGLGMTPRWGNIIAIGICFILNYLGNSLLTFRDK